MPRPHKKRWIEKEPPVTFYKPQGIPLNRLKGVVLSVDGFEALRLADGEGVEHEAAAAAMGVSRPTFSRILSDARHVVAKALSRGWAIRIDGGHYAVHDEPPAGFQGRGARRGRRRRG